MNAEYLASCPPMNHTLRDEDYFTRTASVFRSARHLMTDMPLYDSFLILQYSSFLVVSSQSPHRLCFGPSPDDWRCFADLS